MKREILEGLGLEKETIDKIMAENGKDIEAEKAKTTTAINERYTLQGQLAEANKTIKSYKDMDIEAIKSSAQEWEAKAKEGQAELEKVRQNAAIDKALSETPTIDADMLKKALDLDAISFKDGKIVGLNEQVKQLQKDKAYLFKQEGGPKEDPVPPGMKGYQPKPSDDGTGGKTAMQEQIDAIMAK